MASRHVDCEILAEMSDEPALILFMSAVGLYVLHLWIQDYRAALNDQPSAQALPGAAPTTPTACFIAAAGAVLLLIVETFGEIRLGISAEQTEITLLFGVYTLIAAFIEELIFRGYIVVEGRGKALRWAGIVGASVLFAGLHPFLWSWDMGSSAMWQVFMIWRWSEWLTWDFSTKGVFSTAILFVSSLWFYTVRFASFNRTHSLLPCIVAHGTKNLGVIAVKGYQGFVSGWW